VCKEQCDCNCSDVKSTLVMQESRRQAGGGLPAQQRACADLVVKRNKKLSCRKETVRLLRGSVLANVTEDDILRTL